MSVIIETRTGEQFVCVGPFCAAPDGKTPSRNNRRQFHVGDRLRYVGFRRDKNLADHPSGWLVVFEADDQTLYAATQTFFVTTTVWNSLKKHFAMAKPSAIQIKGSSLIRVSSRENAHIGNSNGTSRKRLAKGLSKTSR